MNVLKVIEIMASSKESWEDAAKNAVNHAGKSLKGIRSVYVKDHSAVVQDNKITEYRVTCKISFEVFD
jgi:dodecin